MRKLFEKPMGVIHLYTHLIYSQVFLDVCNILTDIQYVENTRVVIHLIYNLRNA